jgi:hypothetical protein
MPVHRAWTACAPCSGAPLAQDQSIGTRLALDCAFFGSLSSSTPLLYVVSSFFTPGISALTV